LALYQPQKFLSSPKALHPYAYVGNDPLNHIDPDGLSGWSVFGAIVGAIVGVVLAVVAVALIAATAGVFAAVLIGIGAALVGAGVVGVSYAIASANRGTALGEFFRGFMIGFNAGANAVIGTVLFGPVIGVALGVINFLAAFDSIAGNRVYQGILGWTSWLMPMSWVVNVLGLAAFLFNLVLAGVTFQQVDALKIDKLGIDWKTGSIIMVGGLIRNGTAFNLGHFVFIDPGYVKAGDPERSYEALVAHETGHTLSVAAFGTFFHLYDFIGENLLGQGKSDFGEEIAESHANRPVIR
jgi:MFS family permease